MAPTSDATSPPAAPHPVRRAFGVVGDALLAVGLPYFVVTGFDPGAYERLHVYTQGYDAPALWIFPAGLAFLVLLWRVVVNFGRGRWQRGLLMLIAPPLIVAAPPGSGFPGEDAPLEARAAWADAAYGAGWDAARRAIAADPDVRRRLGTPLAIAPTRMLRRASWGFVDRPTRSIYASHAVEVVGPRGRAEGELMVRGAVGQRRPPFRWGEPGPGRLEVAGTLVFADGAEAPIEAGYPLAGP